MTKQIVVNAGPSGLGIGGTSWVQFFHQTLLDEQIEFVKKQSQDLPERTEQEKAEMSWDSSWDDEYEARVS